MSVSGSESNDSMGPKISELSDKLSEVETEDESDSNENTIRKQGRIISNEWANVKSMFGEMMNDTRAESSMMEKGVDMAVGVLVVGLLTAYLLPIAISEIAGVDTSSWGSAEAQLFGLLPIFFVLAIVLFVVNRAT